MNGKQFDTKQMTNQSEWKEFLERITPKALTGREKLKRYFQIVWSDSEEDITNPFKKAAVRVESNKKCCSCRSDFFGCLIK